MTTGTKKMYFLNNFCCVCMNESDLKHIFDVDCDGISHYNKLTSSVTEMNFKEMNNQRLICAGCCVILNTVYNFRRACLRTKTNLITYISQLQRYSHVSGTLSVCLRDIKHEITIVKEEIQIKCENADDGNSFEDNKLQTEFKTERYDERVHPASAKEERESEGEDREEHAEECQHGNVKIEDVGNETMIEDEYYTRYNDIDVQEDPLAEVKEEPVLDAGITRDGSTSLGVETSGAGDMIKTTAQKAVKKSLKCEMCEKCFIYKYDLIRHMRIHSGHRPYECEICEKSFIEKKDLSTHMKIHSGERPHECDICKKRFIYKYHLTRHMRLHSDERPHRCEVCKKGFIHKSHLTRHMRIHSEEKPYECEICKKSFTQKGYLTLHTKIHTEEKPYECETCKKSFIRKSYLASHMRIHSSDRPYACGMCTKRFIEESDLTLHMKIHSEERRRACEICKKRFLYMSQLISHMRIHSGERS